MGRCKWEACLAILPDDEWDGYCKPSHALAHAAHVRRVATLAWMRAHPGEKLKVDKKARRKKCTRCGEWLTGYQRKFCSDECRFYKWARVDETPVGLACQTCSRGRVSDVSVSGWECGPGLWLRCKPDTERNFYERK